VCRKALFVSTAATAFLLGAVVVQDTRHGLLFTLHQIDATVSVQGDAVMHLEPHAPLGNAPLRLQVAWDYMVKHIEPCLLSLCVEVLCVVDQPNTTQPPNTWPHAMQPTNTTQMIEHRVDVIPNLSCVVEDLDARTSWVEFSAHPAHRGWPLAHRNTAYLPVTILQQPLVMVMSRMSTPDPRLPQGGCIELWRWLLGGAGTDTVAPIRPSCTLQTMRVT
jgi:hypothetical protein